MTETIQYFVYVDRTNEDPPRVFYVGVGNANRVKNMRRNKHHTCIMRKYGIQRTVEFSTTDYSLAKLKEIELIASYHTFVDDEQYEFGCNYTRGGDGVLGHHHTPTLVSRQRMSMSAKKPKSNETKRKMKIAANKRASDASWREKMREVSKTRWQNEEYRNKITEANTGKKRSLEQKQRFSMAQKYSWQDASKRKNASVSAKRRFSAPEEREKVRNKMKSLWADPEYREKMIATRKEKRAARKAVQNDNN